MVVRTVAGRRYSDPDIVSLIDASGGLLDPYSLVRQSAQQLLSQLRAYEVTFENAFQRVCILASIVGLDVKPMDVKQAAREHRDAVLVYMNTNGKKGTIFYNPNKPMSRVVFSIAHEISHSFFPTSRTGARFRSICKEGSRSSRELEMLCHYGASELTMPTAQFRRAVEKYGFGLSSVDGVRGEFGTSFQACLYRMAGTAEFPSAAGLLQFRHRLEDQRRTENLTRELFPTASYTSDPPHKKYRLQSFYYSDAFPKTHVMPWNKSFPESSCVYRAHKEQGIVSGFEQIPVNGRGHSLRCQIEAVRAPFQSDEADPGGPDVLFLLRHYTS